MRAGVDSARSMLNETAGRTRGQDDPAWVRRGAAVASVPRARHGKLLDTAYGMARRLIEDREDLVHKTVGWLLRRRLLEATR